MVCKTCNLVKLEIEFHSKKGELKYNKCRECRRRYTFEWKYSKKEPTAKAKRMDINSKLMLENKRKCFQCEEIKELYLFGKRGERRGGYSTRCKECLAIRGRKWAMDNPERTKILSKRSTERRKPVNFITNLKVKYGLSKIDFDSMLKTQNNKCKICNIEFKVINWRRNFAIDHNHETGKVRGLLCSTCNTGIGLLKESIPVLNDSITYVQNTNNLNLFYSLDLYNTNDYEY